MRLPFGGLFAAAAAGIACAAVAPVGSGWFLFLAVSVLGVWWCHRRSAWILLAVAAGFGAVHVWQTRESPSFALAKIVDGDQRLATATGVVSSEPLAFGEGRSRFFLEANRIEVDGQVPESGAKILVVIKGEPPGRGDTIRATGPLEVVPPPRNPGQFDARRWMALEGITCRMTVAGAADFKILAKARGFSLPRIAGHCRRWMEATLREGISDDPVICDLIAGLVLGVMSSIPDSLRQDFRNTGTFHLFSVSGLHVAMIGVILWQVLRLAGAGRRSAVFIVIPALFFYALITGWKPSSVRAATMAAIFLIGMTASRQPVAFNSLCAAGFFILAQWTSELFNPGFQLSFLVVAAILLLAVPLHDLIRRNFHPDPFVPVQLWTPGQKFGATASECLGGSAAVSLAAWAGSLPLTLAYFHIVSLSALPANILVVPLAFLIMATAALSLVGGLAWNLLAAIFNNANWLFCHLLLVIVQAAASLPGSYFYLGIPERATTTTVTVFDFGSGGAVAIESGGNLWLVDCGPSWHPNGVLLPWLHSRGRTSPDGLILTHGDSRHIGAASELIRGNPVIVDSMLADRSPQRAALHRELAAFGIPKSLCRSGDRISPAPGVALHVLHPPTGLIRDEADDKVLVLRLDAANTRILLLSDAGLPTQQWLVDHMRAELAADILVTGRPRSGLPMAPEFLAAVNPALVVSTAATFPENETLDENWTASLAARGIRLFRQDRTGAVRISISPERYEAAGFLGDGSQLHRHEAQGVAEPLPP